MTLTISTANQSKSKKCTGWAYLLVVALARLWLSIPLDDSEIDAGITIKLWHGSLGRKEK